MFAQRKETGQCLLLKQCVAPGQQKQIEVATFCQCLANLPLIDATANRLDDALVAQGNHRVIAGRHKLLDTPVRCFLGAMRKYAQIMHMQNIDTVDTQPFQRKLK